ncbi:MAG: hypothetical protein ABI068_06110 [Ktedonobacterales bacterium]
MERHDWRGQAPRLGSGAVRAVMGLAIIMLAVLLAGCGATAAAQHPSATATWQIPTTAPVTPTATVAAPVTGTALNWRHTTLPNGFGMLFHSSDAKFAASDGATAYACGAFNATTNQPQMLVAHDRGRTWGTLRTLYGLHNECAEITVDSINSNIAIVHESFANNVGPSLLTTNGGQTWTPTPNSSSLSIQAMATVGGRHHRTERTVPATNCRLYLLTRRVLLLHDGL